MKDEYALSTEVDAELAKELEGCSQPNWTAVAVRHAVTIMQQKAELARLRADNERMRAALEMGLELGESGRHGDGPNCPTCHFVREARKALAHHASTQAGGTMER